MKNKSSYNELFSYAGNRKYLMYLSIFLAFISGILNIIPFIYLFLVVKDIINAHGVYLNTSISFHALMAFVFSIISMLTYFASLMCSHLCAFRISKNMKIAMLKKLDSISIGKVNELTSGKIRKIINDSSNATETLLAHNLPDMVVAYVTPLTSIVLLFVFDYRMGLISLIPVILGFLVMSKMTGKKMIDDMNKYQTALDNMASEATEYVRNMEVVKTFNQSIFSFKRFKQSIDNYSTFCINYTKNCRLPMILFQTLINFTFAFLIGFTLFNINHNVASDKFIMNIMFYIIFTPVFTTTLMKIMFSSENKIVVKDALSRAHIILDCEDTQYGDKEIKGNDIEFKNVSFAYDDKINVLNNINLHIKSNSSLALIGQSGSGKSTLASLIARFYDVNHGEILIDGINIKEYSKESLMNNIAYVFQDNKLLKRSIYENVLMGRKDATREEVLNALSLAMCDDIIAKFKDGVDTVISSKGVFLSLGEQQRICIAREILKNAKIVILDEATAYADPENEYLVTKAISNLTKDKTLIMIAHRLSIIKGMDNIVLLNEGQILDQGNHEYLYNNSKVYQKMYDDYSSSISWKVGE